MAFTQPSTHLNFSSPKNESNSSSSLGHESGVDWNEDAGLPMAAQLVFGFLGLLGLLITIANMLVFLLFCRRRSLRVKTNYILVSLAVSDCMSGTLAIPLLITCSSLPFYSEVVCFGMDVAQRFLAISTILHLTTAVLERYFKIADPFRHTSVVTKSKVVLSVFVIWVISLFTAMVQTSWAHHTDSKNINFIYDIVVLVLLVCFPFSFIVAAYAKMFIIIKQGKSRRKKLSGKPSSPTKYKQNERRAMSVYFAMAICFSIGWFPYFILTVLEDIEYMIDVPFWLSILLLFLKYGTSLVDPLLFTFFKADFQKALRSVICRTNEDNTRLMSYASVSQPRQLSVDSPLHHKLAVRLTGSSVLLSKVSVL